MLQSKAVEAGTLDLLNRLSKKKYLQQFFLVGGTALAIQIGHRRSLDLDFFTVDDFNSEKLLAELLKDFKVTVRQQLPQTLIAGINGITVDFIRFRYLMIRPYIIKEGIRMASREDIAAMKLDAITGRGSKKDYYDLYFLLRQFDLVKILGFYTEKYPHQTTFHVVRSLSYFNDADLQPDPIVIDKKITWAKVKKAISKEIQKL